MKTNRLAVMTLVFLLICANGIQAQTPQPQLNQLEMFKQFIGTWQGEIGKDTIVTAIFTAFGNAIETVVNSSSKDKILSSYKQLIGYDKSADKIIVSELSKSASVSIFAFWFTSNNTARAVPYKDIYNPDKATLQVKYEVKLPDSFTVTVVSNNGVPSVSTYTRIKQ